MNYNPSEKFPPPYMSSNFVRIVRCVEMGEDLEAPQVNI